MRTKVFSVGLLGLLAIMLLLIPRTRDASQEHVIPAAEGEDRKGTVSGLGNSQSNVPVGLGGPNSVPASPETSQLRELRRLRELVGEDYLVVAGSLYVGDSLREGALPNSEDWEALGYPTNILDEEIRRSRNLGDFFPPSMNR